MHEVFSERDASIIPAVTAALSRRMGFLVRPASRARWELLHRGGIKIEIPTIESRPQLPAL